MEQKRFPKKCLRWKLISGKSKQTKLKMIWRQRTKKDLNLNWHKEKLKHLLKTEIYRETFKTNRGMRLMMIITYLVSYLMIFLKMIENVVLTDLLKWSYLFKHFNNFFVMFYRNNFCNMYLIDCSNNMFKNHTKNKLEYLVKVCS